MNAAIWGLIGTLVGAGVSLTVSFISVWKENVLQEKRYQFEREEKARAFQRENLLLVQDLIQKSMRLMCRVHLSDLDSFKRTGVWGKSLLSEELDEEVASNHRELAIITERISNDGLRKEIKELRGQISLSILSSNSDKEAEANQDKATDQFLKLMENIGKELRKNY